MADSRQYECIVFGASGYTGKYTAEHITTHLPTDFRWAVAGRSKEKLQRVVDEIKSLNPDRKPPEIETTQLEKADLVNLAKKTKVLITTVGPYHKYGTVVIEACAETGTHYLDVTGEVPWVYDMVQQYHDTAKRNGAIMIPQNGIESAPTDLMCWMLVSFLREKLNVGTAEVIHTIHEMKASASGGTLATALSLFDAYSLADFAKDATAVVTVSNRTPEQAASKPILEKVSGVRYVDGLGTLTDSIQGPADTPIVHRSWGLYDGGKFYGKKFRLSAYSTASNALSGFAFHVTLASVFTAFILPPVRWLLKQFVYQPGDGPTKEQVKNEYVEWRTIANADVPDSSEAKRAYGRMRFNGSMYHLTGICLAESAIILSREKTHANELGGGILTPATLGQKYLDRLQKAGFEVEMEMMS